MVSRGRGRSRGRPKGRGPLGDRRDGRERPPSMQECFRIRCNELLDRLQKRDTYSVFLEPVDTSEAPDYDKIIKHPMDLTTVRRRVNEGYYPTLEAFSDDLSLIWSNCLLYNGAEPVNIFSKKAIELRKICDRAIPATRNNLEQDQRVLDRWTERHRRKPQPGASPSSNNHTALGDGPVAMSGANVASLSSGTVANTGSVLGPAAAARNGLSRLGSNGNLSISGSAVVNLSSGNSANAFSINGVHCGAGNMSAPMLENAVNAIASIRREALREQYGTTGLFRLLPSASQEPHVFISPDLPEFRPSSVRYNPFAKQPDDSGQDTRQFIPKRRLELSGAIYKKLGSKPRLNPCRPIVNVATLKVKEYVHSLQNFVKDAGVIAAKIIDELLSPELAVLRAEQERKRQDSDKTTVSNAESSQDNSKTSFAQLTGGGFCEAGPGTSLPSVANQGGTATGGGELQKPRKGSSLLPKISRRIDELDGDDGLERLIGADLANEVRAIPLASVDFSMPFGLNQYEMNEIFRVFALRNVKEIDLAFLSQLKQQTDQHVQRLNVQRVSQPQVKAQRSSPVGSSPAERPSTSPVLASTMKGRLDFDSAAAAAANDGKGQPQTALRDTGYFAANHGVPPSILGRTTVENVPGAVKEEGQAMTEQLSPVQGNYWTSAQSRNVEAGAGNLQGYSHSAQQSAVSGRRSHVVSQVHSPTGMAYSAAVQGAATGLGNNRYVGKRDPQTVMQPVSSLGRPAATDTSFNYNFAPSFPQQMPSVSGPNSSSGSGQLSFERQNLNM